MMATKSYQSTSDNGDDEKAPLIKSSQDKAAASPGVTGENFYTHNIRPCLVEFFGTTIVVFVGTLTQQNELQLSNAMGQGLAYSALILTFGRISGGHFNPAVTLGAWIAGGLPFLAALGYWIVQILGSLLGAALTRGCLNYHHQVVWMPPSDETVYYQIMGGATTLQPGSTVATGIFVEFVLTLVLVLVVLMTTVDVPMPTAGLAIGFVIVFAINSGGYVTEAAMNPARALGPAVIISDLRPEVWENHYIYWVGPLLGACAAGLLYRLIYAGDDKRILFKKQQ